MRHIRDIIILITRSLNISTSFELNFKSSSYTSSKEIDQTFNIFTKHEFDFEIIF